MHATGAKRGKTRASEARLVWLLIGWKSAVSFVNQSQSVAKQNQSKCAITFDTQFTLHTLHSNMFPIVILHNLLSMPNPPDTLDHLGNDRDNKTLHTSV